MLNNRFILFALALSAFALWFVVQQSSQEDPENTSTLQSTNYSWQLFDSTTWQFDKLENQQGSIINAKTLFYDDAAKSSDLTEPRIVLIQADKTLFISSKTANTLNDSELQLNGDVILMQLEQPVQELGEIQKNKTLKTQRITYNSKTEKITTDQQVEIIQPHASIIGTGLEIDLKNSRYQLLSNIKGEYRPAQNPN